MVLSASVSGTGAVKRPLSSLQDGCAGWESAPPMSAHLRPALNLPFAHYALIYLDNMGRLKVAESPSIQEQHGTVFTPDVREKFLEILGSKIGYHKPLIRRVSDLPYGYNRAHDVAYHRQGKRRKAPTHDPALDMSFSDHFSDRVEEVPPYSATNMVALEVGDTEKVLEYYETALKHFQQINCRQIAKAFIKFIEPRKQVKHPYNGGRPRAGAPPGEKGDPEKTKPEWWPAGVQHKEPDHLKKEQRLRLLIHILRKLGKFGITSDKLQEVAHDSKRQLRPEEKMEILNEIFRVRRLEERFERGEVDPTTVVYILNRDANPKETKDNESVSDAEKVDGDEEDADEGLMTPPPSSDHLTGSFASIDQMTISQNRSFSIGADRGQLFPLSDPLSFGEHSRPDRPFFTSAAEYPDDYSSHPILKTSAASGVVSPAEQPAAFDYMSHTPYTASAGEQHRPLTMPMQHHVNHFDAWNSPFRPHVYNAIEYGASQAMAQPSIHYQMPMNPTSHVQELSHGIPEVVREKGSHMELMGARGPSFRTGSLNHPNVLTAHGSHPTSG
ncbi:hypothetical protein ARAM_000617 [Aspergillus rambellii]|uniref:Subtelomeric hrmA-associated cluster protein AFUB-079030/YDR124W-like helical bundle domain-containing protein n=1 Tax=Aspergillus rambellii TaxID=308745 RepID=A0A0F8XFV6_9EURO|nr:hypothetical protein ARAM_000617 [Aspergillus rambellii]